MGYKEGALTKKWWLDIINEMLEEGETNVHMTHLEELILKKGQEGYNTAKSFILELLETLGISLERHPFSVTLPRF